MRVCIFRGRCDNISAINQETTSNTTFLQCAHILMYGHTHIARVWINRVRLPTLLVVSRTRKINISQFAFAPENLVSRDGFGRPVPHQPAHLHTQAESGAYFRDSSRVPQRHPFIYFKPPYAIGSVPSLSSHAFAYRGRSLPRVCRHRASSSQGSLSNELVLSIHWVKLHDQSNCALFFNV